jgi:hypothetical protein
VSGVQPSPSRLRELTEKMPNASVTEFGNVNVKARVNSRGTRSTYLVEDFTKFRGQTITRAEHERAAALQDAYIATSPMVVVDGFTGSDPDVPYPGPADPGGGQRVDDTPRRRCDRQGRPGRPGEHAAMAARLRRERKDFPGSFPGLDESLVKSLG